MILKTNLHFHAKEDDYVSYNIYQGIDYAKERGFDVLAYTSHKKFLFKKEYAKYASQKGILLIPGIEIKIKRKEIVVLNCNKEIENIRSFQELRNYKNKNPHILIIAPHPFVLSLKSLRSKLLENIDLFDAIEMTVFSNKTFNFNKKAEEVAEKYNKPFIANSDTHFLKDLERGYALIKVKEKIIESVIAAIREGNFQNKMNSMNPLAMLEFRIKMLMNILTKIYFALH
ncbi:MAG: PHP domain-containing protein [Candidatus Tagabacteria bacterium]